MRKYLLDTHVLVWWLDGDLALGPSSRELIANPLNDIYVSAATVWEMSIKNQLGQLTMEYNMDVMIAKSGFNELPISVAHGEYAGQLPLHHKDPFDRMLITQTQIEGLALITCDSVIPAYGIRIHNART